MKLKISPGVSIWDLDMLDCLALHEGDYCLCSLTAQKTG